ncbi:AAA family ATPase [Aeromicrobium marinum]|uniref:AAA family ATPase n=1 Tax=Aeromicrobium marinum TaxID=219314 RepID=UPI003CCAA46A
MRLHRVTLTNYRGITESTVEFADTGVTLVCGPNEVGKSSIPEALGLIREFKSSSGHRQVKAVKPTHVDAGPCREISADSDCSPASSISRDVRPPISSTGSIRRATRLDGGTRSSVAASSLSRSALLSSRAAFSTACCPSSRSTSRAIEVEPSPSRRTTIMSSATRSPGTASTGSTSPLSSGGLVMSLRTWSSSVRYWSMPAQRSWTRGQVALHTASSSASSGESTSADSIRPSSDSSLARRLASSAAGAFPVMTR